MINVPATRRHMYNPCSFTCDNNIIAYTIFTGIDHLMLGNASCIFSLQFFYNIRITPSHILGFQVIIGSFIFPSQHFGTLDGIQQFIPAPFLEDLGNCFKFGDTINPLFFFFELFIQSQVFQVFFCEVID